MDELRGMFSSLRQPRIIGLFLLASLVLAILFAILLFQHPQSRNKSAAPSYRLQTVTYCSPDNILQLMDIYTPANASSKATMPLVEMVHGGGWTSGSKATINTLDPVPEVPTAVLGLLTRGFIVTSINYRLAPQYKFPADIEDVKCSLRYLRAHAADYHIDPKRIGLMGSSAGGHLVSLAGLAGPSAGFDVGEYTDQSSVVQAVIDMFGPENITSRWGAIGDPLIFGSWSGALYAASPASYIAKAPNTDPPFLILQGDKDRTVPPFHSLQFYNELLDAGQPAILQMVQNAGHEFDPQGTAIIPSADQISTMMIQFFLKYLAGGVPPPLSPSPSTSFSNPLPQQAF
jgi:acetyl esterase/lipase